MQREATLEPLMKLGIQLHAFDCRYRHTSCVLESFGVDRARSTIHNWVQKADLQPAEGKNSDHVAVEETVIQLND